MMRSAVADTGDGVEQFALVIGSAKLGTIC